VHPVGTADQPDRLAGDPHADLQLGTDRNEVDESRDGPGQEGLALVPSVKAHLQTGQARGDPHENRLVIHPERFNAGPRFSPGAKTMDKVSRPGHEFSQRPARNAVHATIAFRQVPQAMSKAETCQGQSRRVAWLVRS